jgi:hypothetical protein
MLFTLLKFNTIHPVHDNNAAAACHVPSTHIAIFFLTWETAASQWPMQGCQPK